MQSIRALHDCKKEEDTGVQKDEGAQTSICMYNVINNSQTTLHHRTVHLKGCRIYPCITWKTCHKVFNTYTTQDKEAVNQPYLKDPQCAKPMAEYFKEWVCCQWLCVYVCVCVCVVLYTWNLMPGTTCNMWISSPSWYTVFSIQAKAACKAIAENVFLANKNTCTAMVNPSPHYGPNHQQGREMNVSLGLTTLFNHR